jgi:hypothetical protein
MKYPAFVFLLFSLNLHAQSPAVSPAHPVLEPLSNVRDLAVSADQTEWFFSIQSPDGAISRIATFRKKGKGWTSPELMPFSETWSDLEPFLSADGRRLYFASNRPKNATDSAASDFDIWFVERSSPGGAWSAPKNPGAPVNTPGDEFYPSLTTTGDLYFTTEKAGGAGRDDIWHSRWNGTAFEQPEPIGSAVNTEGMEFNAFVAPDGSFLLFSRYNAAGAPGSGDLFIARKDASGVWQPAQLAGDAINTRFMEFSPFYDANAKTLYFASRRNALENKPFKSAEAFLNHVRDGQNGLLKLYKVQVDLSGK